MNTQSIRHSFKKRSSQRMSKFPIKKLGMATLISIFVMTLGGCSIYDSGYTRPVQRSVPKIPEVKAPVVKRKVTRTINKRVSARARTVKKPAVPARRFVGRRPKYTITSKMTVMADQKAIQEKLAVKHEALRVEAKKRATVNIDPYATIPESRATSSRKRGGLTPPAPPIYQSSSAVKSLMSRARADLVISNTQSAITKLERGLRIEPQNALIWNLLAKANYQQGDNQQAITMAKKSIRYAGDDTLITKNWTLIKKAGEKSDDSIALKEAQEYFKAKL